MYHGVHITRGPYTTGSIYHGVHIPRGPYTTGSIYHGVHISRGPHIMPVLFQHRLNPPDSDHADIVAEDCFNIVRYLSYCDYIENIFFMLA